MFELLCDQVIDVSRNFVGGVSSSKVTTLFSLGCIGLVKVEI